MRTQRFETEAEIGLASRLNECATAAFPLIEGIQSLLTFLLTNCLASNNIRQYQTARNKAKQ